MMKAEPESRLEKGVDVKFSIDDLRDRTEPEAWDGKSALLLTQFPVSMLTLQQVYGTRLVSSERELWHRYQ